MVMESSHRRGHSTKGLQVVRCRPLLHISQNILGNLYLPQEPSDGIDEASELLMANDVMGAGDGAVGGEARHGGASGGFRAAT